MYTLIQQVFIDHLNLPHSAKQQWLKVEEDMAPVLGKKKRIPGTSNIGNA